MKFLNIKNYNNCIINYDKEIKEIKEIKLKNTMLYLYKIFDYEKNFIKNRKKTYLSRPGVPKYIKKMSIYRDYSNSLLQQFINLNTKKGNKVLFFKHYNVSIENLYYCFNNNINEFNKYKNYSNFFYVNNINSDFSNFNILLKNTISDFESIFEIKTKKNNKKLKLKEKYSHEICYIPREKRLKYVLRSLSIYIENFKNYNLWERLFWSFFTVLVNKDKSFLKKRRDYIYLKSIKFFKKKKNI